MCIKSVSLVEYHGVALPRCSLLMQSITTINYMNAAQRTTPMVVGGGEVDDLVSSER
jgi:hypothetical protein